MGQREVCLVSVLMDFRWASLSLSCSFSIVGLTLSKSSGIFLLLALGMKVIDYILVYVYLCQREGDEVQKNDDISRIRTCAGRAQCIARRNSSASP